jgi:bacteriocin-like protein
MSKDKKSKGSKKLALDKKNKTKTKSTDKELNEKELDTVAGGAETIHLYLKKQ